MPRMAPPPLGRLMVGAAGPWLGSLPSFPSDSVRLFATAQKETQTNTLTTREFANASSHARKGTRGNKKLFTIGSPGMTVRALFGLGWRATNCRPECLQLGTKVWHQLVSKSACGLESARHGGEEDVFPHLPVRQPWRRWLVDGYGPANGAIGVKTHTLNLTVGGPLVLALFLAENWRKFSVKKPTKSPHQEAGFTSSFLGENFRKNLDQLFDQNSIIDY